MVTKDLSKYIELLKGWEVEDGFAEGGTFGVLTEIGNLFVIGPEALRERLRGVGGKGGGGGSGGDGGGGAAATGGAAGGVGVVGGMGWEAADLRPYVLRREDVGSVGVQSALSAL